MKKSIAFGALALSLVSSGAMADERRGGDAALQHDRSSANRGKAASSALPPSPIGLPSADSVCVIGPAAMVLEITTMPISESVPCQASAARTPEKRPAE